VAGLRGFFVSAVRADGQE